ncbi:carbon monoxide dehydrogenase [Intrasporangium chromatireducens Q5-1]|uniref:Carbon monoxide dehydrogenase n=1 Tax=Intrasporangium chromatireducens Q5-1 TaxID=584657 RepID=W9GGJ2_9MICO|nr:FAD binding domain-containing protein [Intrasporangium chromatireducens]EWT05175.1 carbon monoxide dehydrogenase [Intrasporangium chromatireducens Q5-1]
MKPAPFAYLRARSVAEALEMLGASAHRDADAHTKVLAGGQSLLTLMNLRLARPDQLVDIGGLMELSRTFEDTDSVVLGALVRHRTLETDPKLGKRLPLVAAAAGQIGHVAIRNRGTLGGSLSHADPAAELPLAMLVHEAVIHVESATSGRRTIRAEDFVESIFTTTMQADELLTWVTVPSARPGQGWGFVEFAPRIGDYAQAGAACLVTVAPDGSVAAIRAGLLAAADRPLVVSEPGDEVSGIPTHETWERLAAHWTRNLEPLTDDPDHTRHLCRAALSQALADAYRRARTDQEEAA